MTGPVLRSDGCIEAVGRLRLCYRTWETAQPTAALVLVHGLAEHAGRYAGFGEAMAGAGVSTFALDLRGHGASDGRRGYVRRFDVFLQDLDRFRREVQGLVEPRCPLFLFGHSMGGLIAVRYLEEYEGAFRGGVIASPWLATAVRVPRWKMHLAHLLDRALPALPMKAGIRPEHLSHDPQVVADYRDDPLVHGTITPRLFVEASHAMALAFQRSDRIAVPLLFLLAGRDHIVETERTLAFARALRGAHAVRVFPESFHELLNEPDRPAAVAEVRDWLRAYLE